VTVLEPRLSAYNRQIMSQAQKPTVEQVIKLVDQLTPDERDQVLDQLNYEKLQRAIQIGIEQADRGEVVDGEIVLAQLRQRAEDRLRKTQ
jgi:hypothetical protein